MKDASAKNGGGATQIFLESKHLSETITTGLFITMAEKILTLHPQGKSGANISRAKYEMVRDAIIRTLAAENVVSFEGLTETISQELEGEFDGSIPWYVTTVKLDLEARHIIERAPDQSPQQLRLAQTTKR